MNELERMVEAAKRAASDGFDRIAFEPLSFINAVERWKEEVRAAVVATRDQRAG